MTGRQKTFRVPALRVLAPGGSFSSPFQIRSARDLLRKEKKPGERSRDTFERIIKNALGVDAAFVFGSGKECLTRIFSTLREIAGHTVVGLGEFTCPDIAVAAVRAGCRLRLFPINLSTLELEVPERLSSPLAAVVLSNLFGLPDRIPKGVGSGTLVVDDGCQSMLSSEGGVQVGARSGTIGIASFGRGKAYSGIGGGAVLFPRNCEETFERLSITRDRFQARLAASTASLPDDVKSSECRYLLSAAGYWLFHHPRLYAIPACLPLGLGETPVRHDFVFRDMSETEIAVACSRVISSDDERSQMVLKAERWHRGLAGVAFSGLSLIEPFYERGYAFDTTCVPLRYPIIFPTEEARNAAFALLSSQGLGASLSYNRSLREFPELVSHIEPAEDRKPDDLPRRLLTLPVHKYVTLHDIDRGVELIRSIRGQTLTHA